MMELLGDIRFLCNRCNTTICLLRDNIEPAVSYVDHGENGMGQETIYVVQETVHCPQCGNIVSICASGNEYPQGAFDSTSNSIEGGTYISEPVFQIVYDKPQRRDRLLSTIISFCDNEYTAAQSKHPCSIDQCTHDCKQQRGNSLCNCISCLEQVHYHYGRQTYNCPNLVNCYGCRYLNKFVSEFSYALRELKYIKGFKQFRVISIGCGPAPDLMALEEFRHENGLPVSLQYRGFDLNKYWAPIHRQIEQYCGTVQRMDAKFYYEDAVEVFAKKDFPEANVLVLQYVISHFHNTHQFDQLHHFFESIAENIISKMLRPSIVIIHDINHWAYGRDQFSELKDILKKRGIHGVEHRRYFDNNISDFHQRYGKPYPSIELLYPPTEEIRNKYCRGNNDCSGVSLILELGAIE